MNIIVENKQDIIDDFISVFKKRKENQELEIIFKNNYCHLLKLILNKDKFNNPLYESKRYLEYVSQISKFEKERVRLNDNYFYFKNIKQLKDNFLKKNEEIIKKTKLIDLSIEKKTYFIQLANEEVIYSLKDNKNIKLYFVTLFRRHTSNFLIELKFKTKLFLKQNQNIYDSYYDKNNNPKLTIEIELIDKNQTKELLISDLNKILSYLFCKKINDDIILYNSIFNESVKLKTLSMQISKLKDYINKNVYFTKKVDGENVLFIINNGVLCCNIYGFYHQFVCDVNPKYEIKGFGEYVKNDDGLRELYPYYIENATYKNKIIDLSTRSKHFEFIYKFTKNNKVKNSTYYSDHKSINDKSKESISIVCKKIYGPFNSYEDILINFSKCYVDNNVFFTDGVILFLDDLNHDDKKLKLDPTIDVVALLSNVNMLKKNSVDLDLFYVNKKNELVPYKKLTYDNLIYDHNNEGFIYNNEYFLPIIFIVEYSILNNKIVKIRFDKLMKLLQNNYKGNPENTIKNSIKIVEENITFEFLSNIDDSNVSYFIDKIEYIENNNNTLENKTSIGYDIDKDFDWLPLNYKNTWYKELMPNEKNRPTFNYLCNLVKSILIYYSTNIMSNFKIDRKRLTVFDVNSGPLTDMYKYILNNISHVIATDPDKNTLNKGLLRYKNAQNKNNSIFKLITINKFLEEIDYFKICDDKILKYNFPKKYDLIHFGFNIHFFYNNQGKDKYYNLLKKYINNNGIIAITTNNGNKIKNKLNKYDEIIFNYSDHFVKITKRSDDTINYFNSSSMDEAKEEYLIYDTEIINDHKEKGYELLFKRRFDYFIKNPEYFQLLSKLNSKRVESSSGEKFLNDLIKVSKDENDLIQSKLYMCYLFINNK